MFQSALYQGSWLSTFSQSYIHTHPKVPYRNGVRIKWRIGEHLGRKQPKSMGVLSKGTYGGIIYAKTFGVLHFWGGKEHFLSFYEMCMCREEEEDFYTQNLKESKDVKFHADIFSLALSQRLYFLMTKYRLKSPHSSLLLKFCLYIIWVKYDTLIDQCKISKAFL